MKVCYLAPSLRIGSPVIQQGYISPQGKEDALTVKILAFFNPEEIYLYAHPDYSTFYWELVKRAKSIYREWHLEQGIAFDDNEEKIKSELYEYMKKLFSKHQRKVFNTLVRKGFHLQQELNTKVLTKKYGRKTGKELFESKDAKDGVLKTQMQEEAEDIVIKWFNQRHREIIEKPDKTRDDPLSAYLKAKTWDNYCRWLTTNVIIPQILAPKVRVKRVKTAKVRAGRVRGFFELRFKNDVPGIWKRLLLLARGRMGVVQEEYLETVSGATEDVFMFNVIARNEEHLKEIEKFLSIIEDVSDPVVVQRKTYTLDVFLEMRHGRIALAEYLEVNRINISRFVTPEIDPGNDKDSTYFMQLEVPTYIIEHQLRDSLRKLQGVKIVEFKQGDLIEKIIDDILFKRVPRIKNEQLIPRSQLREALGVIASLKLSRMRKDGRSFVMAHQISIIDILVNKFKIPISTEEDNELAQLLIIAAILHDAIEDGDITKKEIIGIFGEEIASIVSLVSRPEGELNEGSEANFLQGILEGRGEIGEEMKKILKLLAQLLKIADRIHNKQSPYVQDPHVAGDSRPKTKDSMFNTVFIPGVLAQLLEEQTSNKSDRLSNEWIEAGYRAIIAYVDTAIGKRKTDELQRPEDLRQAATNAVARLRKSSPQVEGDKHVPSESLEINSAI